MIILIGAIGFLVAILFDSLLLQSFPNWFYILYAFFHITILLTFSKVWYRRIAFITILVVGWGIIIWGAYAIFKCDLVVY